MKNRGLSLNSSSSEHMVTWMLSMGGSQALFLDCQQQGKQHLTHMVTAPPAIQPGPSVYLQVVITLFIACRPISDPADLHLRGIATSRVTGSQGCLKSDNCKDKRRESLTQRRDGEGRQGTGYLRTITDLLESVSVCVIHAGIPVLWGLQTGHSDNERSFSFLQYSSFCLLASYFIDS